MILILFACIANKSKFSKKITTTSDENHIISLFYSRCNTKTINRFYITVSKCYHCHNKTVSNVSARLYQTDFNKFKFKLKDISTHVIKKNYNSRLLNPWKFTIILINDDTDSRYTNIAISSVHTESELKSRNLNIIRPEKLIKRSITAFKVGSPSQCKCIFRKILWF